VIVFTKSRRAQSDTDYETWIAGEVTPTLNVFDNATETRATVLIIDGTRVNDVRVYEDEIVQTVIQRWGTGGGNVPYVFPIHDTATRSEGKRKLHDGTHVMDGKGNGLGVGQDGDPMNTLTSGDRHAVAYSIREDAKANNFSATEIETARALQATQPSVQSHHAQTFIAEPAVVRRLTPLECERLQGFPDGWTEDQADTSRYKQMGNAVTVNVISWIGSRL
jgi:DNA (cytosine-5)-methyltransferase 1